MLDRRSSVRVDDGTLCPVSDTFLSRLYRAASPAEIRELALSLSVPARVRLATFCYARSHLREIAREIAIICSPTDLARAGTYGRALVEGSAEWVPHVRGTSKITLATPEDMRPRSAPDDFLAEDL